MQMDKHAQADADNKPTFTVDWFESARPVWDLFVPRLEASRVLEVGSYEGASACYLIQVLGQKAPLEIHCIDQWAGGVEHRSAGIDMEQVEARFLRNTSLAVRASPFPVDLHIHKGHSDLCLARLLSQQPRPRFDFIYIDGSHQAADVLLDATMGFRLLGKGGVMVFDDYLWHEGPPESKDLMACPKMAIDAFINCNFNKLRIVSAPLYQVFLQKLAD